MKYAMKDASGVEVRIHSFLTSAIGRNGQRHACDYFTLDARWIRGWMGSRVGSDAFEKTKISTMPGTELRISGCPVRSLQL